MTRVCLVGDEDVTLQYELLSRETSRNALRSYDIREPFRNTVAVETVSLGAAVSLCNDLNWYLVRFVEDALVLEPSVSETEWLSRDLATAIRDDRADPAATGRFLKVYGIREPASDTEGDSAGVDTGPSPTPDDTQGEQSDTTDTAPPADSEDRPPELLDPMLVTRTGDRIPEYDLYEVEDTLVVRVTEAEFG